MVEVVDSTTPQQWEVATFQGNSDMPLKTHKIALDPNNKHRAWLLSNVAMPVLHIIMR